MCILRDRDVASAWEAYEELLNCGGKEWVSGIGLDGEEAGNGPLKFKALFEKGREDGFRVTAHCDFDAEGVREHLGEVVGELGGGGADRVDHGMNLGDEGMEGVVEMVRGRGVGLTVCPCAYIRHKGTERVFGGIRRLLKLGVRVMISSDDPAYMGDNWVWHNLLMVRDQCALTDGEMSQLMKNAVEMCWAAEEVKVKLLGKIEDVEKRFGVSIAK